MLDLMRSIALCLMLFSIAGYGQDRDYGRSLVIACNNQHRGSDLGESDDIGAYIGTAQIVTV